MGLVPLPPSLPSKIAEMEKSYIGPYLITKVLPPVDAVLQKSKRGKPFVAHFDN